jgi:hypothetical protein
MELDAITAEVPAEAESAHTSSRKSARNARIELITRKRQPLAAYRFGGLECMLLGPGEGGLMSMIG